MKRSDLTKLCKDKRQQLGITQQKLADKIGVEKPRISEFENNKSNLNTDTLLNVLDVLELKIS